MEAASKAARVGASNGTSRQAAFDRWFRYPAGFSTSTLDALIADRSRGSGTILDPFCGAATVGTRSLAHGFRFAGVEAHPEIAELATLKTAVPPSGEDLMLAAKEVVGRAEPLEIDSETDLVRRCFAPTTLAELVGIRRLVQAAEPTFMPYLKWALLGSLRDLANVKVGWPYLRPVQPRTPPYRDPSNRFLTRVGWMVDDLLQLDGAPSATIVHGDASSAKTWQTLEAQKLQATVCLTSPPYLNNFDYADATRLEMFFWGRSRTWSGLCEDIRSGMLVASTQQSSVGGAERAEAELRDCFPAVQRAVQPLVSGLRTERVSRTRGKEYDRVLPAYMLGITRVLEQISNFMAPNSWCGWVVGDSAPYGVYVDTPNLIQQAATTLGYWGMETIVLRERGMRWPTKIQRETTRLNERLIWMRTP